MAGLGDHTIRTTFFSGGKERMHRLMKVLRAKAGSDSNGTEAEKSCSATKI